MKAGQTLGALLLAGVCLPAWGQSPALTDADLLYCARAYAEGATLLKDDPDRDVRKSAREAQTRASALGTADTALLAKDPARHQRAIAQAQQRLLAMPVAPLEARRLALRAAYVECRYLEASSGEVTPPATAAAPVAPVVPVAPVAPVVPVVPVAPVVPAAAAATVATKSRTTATAAAPAAVPVPVPLPVATLVAPSPAVSTPAAPPAASSADIWAKTSPAPPPVPEPAVRARQGASTPRLESLPGLGPEPLLTGTATAALTAAPVAATRTAAQAAGKVAASAVIALDPASSRPAEPARGTARPPLEATLPPAPVLSAKSRKDSARQPAAATSRTAANKSAAPTAPAGLSDDDLLYCTQVYNEVSSTFSDDKGEAADAAREAKKRWLPLSGREHDLLNDQPGRHSRASAAAKSRLALLPDQASRARSMALRSAYEECISLEDRAASARPAPGIDRTQMLAKRNFCRDLLLRKLKVSEKVRAGFSPSELAALDEIQKIGDALAQPLPGAPVTQEQDREANRLARQLREALDRAAANWKGGPDPAAQAIGQCHDDYVEGLLGGPDVLSPPMDNPPVATRTVTTTAAPAARAQVVRPADLGTVFHMREATPAGTIDGIWIRRGPDLYDAIWVQASNGQMQRDVLEVRGIVNGELTIYRQGYRGNYSAKVRANGTLEPGTASWFSNTTYSWIPLPTQYVRGGDLGPVVHMREVTVHGNYEGIWRQRGQTGVYDVLWVFVPTGEITADVLEVSGVAKGQLIIRRLDGPGLYSFKRRGDVATGGASRSQWVVVPAQPVKLGGATR